MNALHRWCLVLIGITSGMAGIIGCSRARTSHEEAPRSPREGSSRLLIAAVDRSGSTDAVREQQLNQLDLIAKIALSSDIPLSVWAFDNKAIQIWGDRVPHDLDALDGVKSKHLTPVQDNSRRITRPALLLEALNDHLKRSSAQQVYIVILTDGDSEDANDTPRILKAARDIATRPNMHVCIAGVRPEARSLWKKAFGEMPEDRMDLLGPEEAGDVLQQFLQKITN
ncbi:MAG: VWA domain-containing protein [Chloroherpetonaceae bacterium]|nr:VWA domain-containing protein [Chthonomonadaceae bacterium]MDW8209058.1 VWA domain-containing protein [Chloroherpetonaceae bacterium]